MQTFGLCFSDYFDVVLNSVRFQENDNSEYTVQAVGDSEIFVDLHVTFSVINVNKEISLDVTDLQSLLVEMEIYNMDRSNGKHFY